MRLITGDALEVLPTLGDASVDSVVTDPPAGISFMGEGWDGKRGGREWWIKWLSSILRECWRIAKPGARLLCWAIPRTSHWTGCAVEDAGWLIEDRISHLFGTGFPKGESKLKPACEDWWLARKPGPRVLPLNVDECRIPSADGVPLFGYGRRESVNAYADGLGCDGRTGEVSHQGRYPASITHDGSDEVLEAFAAFGERHSSGAYTRRTETPNKVYGKGMGVKEAGTFRDDYCDTGSAARFFYCAKASKAERGEGNGHPTVKSLALMHWLVRLITPKGGVCLDPFAGSGTTGVACVLEGRDFIGIEQHAPYVEIARRRIAEAEGPLFATALTEQGK